MDYAKEIIEIKTLLEELNNSISDYSSLKFIFTASIPFFLLIIKEIITFFKNKSQTKKETIKELRDRYISDFEEGSDNAEKLWKFCLLKFGHQGQLRKLLKDKMTTSDVDKLGDLKTTMQFLSNLSFAKAKFDYLGFNKLGEMLEDLYLVIITYDISDSDAKSKLEEAIEKYSPHKRRLDGNYRPTSVCYDTFFEAFESFNDDYRREYKDCLKSLYDNVYITHFI